MILKIKEDGFTVDVNKYFLYQVIQKSIEKAGGVSKLSIILVQLTQGEYNEIFEISRVWVLK